MHGTSADHAQTNSPSSPRRASFFPLLYGAAVGATLLFGGMAGAMLGDSSTGETPPEAVAFVDVVEVDPYE